MLNELLKSTVRNHRDFRGWFYFVEALDAQLKAILQKSKFGEATPEQIKAAVEELEKEYQDKASPDKGAAFKFMQTKLGLKAGESKEGPTDPFLLNYYKKLREKQIFPEEYKTLEYFKDENKELLSEMMEKLRAFISQNKITLSFDNKPRIKFRNELMDYNDFTQFLGNIHSIEGQLADVNADKYQNPAFLEMLHNGDLVAKGNNIWVFKGDDPIKCRVMGKGQSWCISSSTSAENYFNYRHKYGQTQYFIFDFNKAPDDPARYVNPGVAPAGQYSEWVDRRNTHSRDFDGVGFGVEGYRSLQEYLAYLKSKGVDTSVFVADPITPYEMMLRSYVNGHAFEAARNYPDERKTKDGIPYMFYYYLKIINNLTDEQFDSLSDIEKQEFIMGKNAITGKQAKYIESKGIKFVKEYINSVDNIGTLLKNAENADEMAKFILQHKKELREGTITDCLIAARNKLEMLTLVLQRQKQLNDIQVNYLLQNAEDKDEITKLILQHKKELTDENITTMLLFAKNKDEIAKLILQHKKELTDNNAYHLLAYAKNKEEIAKLILQHKKELSNKNVHDLLQYAGNKGEMAELILQHKKELNDDNVSNFLKLATNKDEMANFIIQNKKKLSGNNVRDLLKYAGNQNEMAELLGSENINKLSDSDIYDLLHYGRQKTGDELAKIIIKYTKDLSDHNVFGLLRYATNLDEIAELLGSENINKLGDEHTYSLLYDTTDRNKMANIILKYKTVLSHIDVKNLLHMVNNPDEMAKIILQKKEKLNDWEVHYLLQYTTNKDEIAKLILQHKKELSKVDIYLLLRYVENQNEIAKLILQHKKELNDDDVHDFLRYAKNKAEIAELLGKENINKLSDKNVDHLIKFAPDRDEMTKLIQQYKQVI